MEIKDAISLYTFLGQLGLWGAIAFSIIIIVLVGYIISITTEKVIEKVSLRRQILVTTLLVTLICMIILIGNSTSNIANTSDATAIKSYMVSMKWKWLGYNRLAKEVNLPELPSLKNVDDNKIIDKRINHIKEIVSKFPNEFEITTVFDSFSKDSMGIELIDTNAVNVINKYNEEMLPYFTAKVINYMTTQELDTISYNYIMDSIDNRLQPYLIDKIVATSTNTFIPININYDYGLVLKHP